MSGTPSAKVIAFNESKHGKGCLEPKICEGCGKTCIDTDAGYITGCEHYPLKPVENPSRKTNFLELIIKHQVTDNPVTSSVYREIIGRRVAEKNYV